MGPKVLGRITAPTGGPRGPDVQMNLVVPAEWILSNATIEIELPRNLACANCGGGGCDACERSGAVSLRGRDEAAETVEVTLQASSVSDDVPSSRTRRIVLRIPERGGHAPKTAGADVPRGNLLLSVRAGPAPPRGVTRLTGPSTPPEAPIEVAKERRRAAPSSWSPPGLPMWPVVLAAAALAALLAWLLRPR